MVSNLSYPSSVHILVTGHTGFKGSWFSLLARELGHRVSGVSLTPETNSIFSRCQLESIFEYSIYEDIRDKRRLNKVFQKVKPDALIHLAAQPIVRKSYLNPLDTFETNVMGTWNVLQEVSGSPSIKASLFITTDKVYLNDNSGQHFIETDPLGAADPYSTSKAAADLLIQSWKKCHSKSLISIARAGNVIGGGDIGEDRLIPDIIRAVEAKKSLSIRFPNSTRPWQHVLDCVNGYLVLLEKSYSEKIDGVWNFGPLESDEKSVENVVGTFLNKLGKKLEIEYGFSNSREEANRLMLNSEKAVAELEWSRKFSSDDAIKWTADFYLQLERGVSHFDVMRDQITKFRSL